MTDLTLTRDLRSAPEKVFEFITRTPHLLTWWGPEGMHISEHALSFETTGPWMSVMTNAAGQNYKVSGQVTHVDPPHSIGFTWAWHDENDRRGVESHVTIKLVPAQNGGTRVELNHVDLPDDESAKNHQQGWSSTLNKLQKLAD
ncbi:MAG: SRPBCC domain-containing protein [Maritimibacter sp.]|nr:SRPBCC domain-containing protein [Maritimibacter sp.]